MKLTNNHNLPQALYSALSNDLYVQHGHISVTGLIQPPRIRQLTQRYADHIEEDAADGIWRLLGSAVHDVLQRAETDGMQEQRLSMEVAGWRVTGQADLMEGGVLSDYKITSVWAAINGVKPEWESQLNCYAALMLHHGVMVQDAQIVCIYRDWSKGRSKQGGDYPRIPAGVMRVNLWPYKEAEAYMESRVKQHQAAELLPDDELPICTPEERWERPTTYAVMKKGRKSAVRVLDNEADADAMALTKGDGHYVETRPGVSVRCADYCPVNRWCDFYNE